MNVRDRLVLSGLSVCLIGITEPCAFCVADSGEKELRESVAFRDRDRDQKKLTKIWRVLLILLGSAFLSLKCTWATSKHGQDKSTETENMTSLGVFFVGLGI